MTEQEALDRMTSPNVKRRCWGEGILQIHITSACDKSCFGCTQGSNLDRKLVMMSVEEFEQAVISLKDYFGIVGIFGGNPCLHPKFDEICSILRKHIPFERCGLWTNKLFGHGKTARITFNPNVTNINVHNDQDGYDEISRDWPELLQTIKGHKDDSRHTTPYVALLDVMKDEAERWDLIADCDINKHWSSMICTVPTKGLRGFFCEIAAAQAMLHAHDSSWPDIGVEVKPGWWDKNIIEFAEQVKFYCHRCGVPLRRFGQLANGGNFEEVSKTHFDIYKPKDKNRRVELVTMESQAARKLDLMINYIENSTLE